MLQHRVRSRQTARPPRGGAVRVLALAALAPWPPGALTGCDLQAADILDSAPGPAPDPGELPASPPVICGQSYDIPAPAPPEMLLVVDRSESMSYELRTGEVRWPILRDAVNGLVTAHETATRFGLMTYPTGDACDPGQVRVAVGPHTGEAIAGALAATRPEGGTPIDGSLAAALAYFAGRPVTGPRHVLLATDGWPTCKDGNVSTRNDEAAFAAAEQLFRAGVPVYVLGFGEVDAEFVRVLQALARRGGTDHHYEATSAEELATAFTAIRERVNHPTCSYPLTSPAAAGRLQVHLDQRLIPQDARDGWLLAADGTLLVLNGRACEELRSGRVTTLHIEHGCDAAP